MQVQILTVVSLNGTWAEGHQNLGLYIYFKIFPKNENVRKLSQQQARQQQQL